MLNSNEYMYNVLSDQGIILDMPEYQLRQFANSRFRSEYVRGQAGQVWASITRRDNCLLTTYGSEKKTLGNTANGYHAGIQSVPISQIKGSISRACDFDLDFRPLRSHVKDRWINVAVARQRGVPLPPVELVQVGEDYYVRDGHHRISVARSLGEMSIDAEVVVRTRSKTVD
jgi:hypothetical protein